MTAIELLKPNVMCPRRKSTARATGAAQGQLWPESPVRQNCTGFCTDCLHLGRTGGYWLLSRGCLELISTGPAREPGHHSRNVRIFAEGEVDRSATGSGVSARAAVHHAKGELALNEGIHD